MIYRVDTDLQDVFRIKIQVALHYLDSCTLPVYLSNIIPDCTSFYSWNNEEEGAFHPGWSPMEGSDVTKLPKDHQSAWIWQSALAVNGTPFWGIFANYWGGGKLISFVVQHFIGGCRM